MPLWFFVCVYICVFKCLYMYLGIARHVCATSPPVDSNPWNHWDFSPSSSYIALRGVLTTVGIRGHAEETIAIRKLG